ncbi:10604_t:CDS:1, partial [Funneliformis mosseae]
RKDNSNATSSYHMEAVVAEISRQLCSWNLYTRQDGVVTTSQGRFNFQTTDGRNIRAPDVPFTPKTHSIS